MSIIAQDDNVNNISWLNIFISLLGIFFLRIFFENFSSPINAAGDIVPWQGFLLHIPLSYIAIFLSLLLVIYLITQTNIKRVAIFLTFAHLLVLLPPVLDFIVNGIKPNSIIGYQLLDTSEFLNYMIKVWSFEQVTGTTFGMRIAVIFLASTISIFIIKQTKNYLKALMGFLSVFVTMFLYANVPSFLIIIQSLRTEHFPGSKFLLDTLINNSWTNNISSIGLNVAYDLILSQIFFLLIIMQLATIFYFLEKKSWLLIFHNIRPERIFNYCLIAFIGILIGQKNFFNFSIYNTINLITLSVFICLLILNALLAIFINDLYDIQIDKISNQQRPLARNIISLEKWKKICFTFFILFTFGLLTMNTRVIFFMLLMQLLFFIYSTPPLKLKRYFLPASILLGLTTGCASLAGFFLVSSENTLFAFPYKILLTIILSQALLSNMKDIKDFEGDKNENIKTLPVIFGLKIAKIIIALFYVLVFITIPVFFSLTSLLPFAIIISIFSFYLFTKKNYQEKPIFLMIFIYLFFLLLYTNL